MTVKMLKHYLLILFASSFLFSCGDSDVPQEKSTISSAEPTVVQLPAETPDLSVVGEASTKTETVFLPNQVVYQEEIYKNWPYTEAPVINAEMGTTEKVTEAVATATEQAGVRLANVDAAAEEKATVVAANDKPYQLVDGKISANAIEGWKTYNGGGACHGKGGIGAVGPDLGKSVTTKLSKVDFVDIVTNGKSGTMMRPHKTNKRVMDNMDNLYAYLLARGDGVLGPGNLIKMPLGK